MCNNRPLASIYVRLHNQRQYVEALLDATFRQTYRPLEIVISDDGSTDGSDKIINDCIVRLSKLYPEIKVINNRNEPKLGMFLNGVKAQRLSHGELMIQQDGDDIPLPNRVERIVSAWVKGGKKALAIYHDAWRIDLSGNKMGSLSREYFINRTMGAVSTYARALLNYYDPVSIDGAVEDVTYGNRARFLDGIMYLKEKLLYYRVGSGASSGWHDYRKRQLLVYRRDKKPALEQGLIDIEHVKDRMKSEDYNKYKSYLENEISYCNAAIDLMSGDTFRERLLAYKKLNGGSTSRRLLNIVFLLPHKLCDIFLNGGSNLLEKVIRLRAKLSRSPVE